MNKEKFKNILDEFLEQLDDYVSTNDNQWKIKGFIDNLLNVYTISSDTKIISKILEIHLFPLFLDFANKNGFELVPAQEQNWYPDISLVLKSDPTIRFAIDLKTTYRTGENKCNGFTLGSHGEYFINRTSEKNIQFPYGSYKGHYCLGIIYDKSEVKIDETEIFTIDDIKNIKSVISNFTFFAQEKWKIASDRGGSGNTANIGSINEIDKIILGEGVFIYLGEEMFDEYWMNQGKMIVRNPKGGTKKLTKVEEFLEHKNMDTSLINKPKFQGK
ncbi:MAG: EcoRV family type II restriction endonuclease [Candidatus Absconditabacterales bacterium]|nr:EcoRV family type II restriction endonuclease [Candidatus Absconditabacterales bacterium]